MWLCGKHVVGPDPEAALVRAAGAETIVSFVEPSDLESEYPAYVRWLRLNDGGSALWFPIPDFEAPPLQDAVLMVHAIAKRLVAGEGVILHCAGGIGRAPTIAICVLIELGMGAGEAATHVAAHRPTAGPEVQAQQQLVDAFAARWRADS